MRPSWAEILVPGAVAVLGVVLLLGWTGADLVRSLQARVPGLDGAPLSKPPEAVTRPQPGQPTYAADTPAPTGAAKPSSITGSWPWFRGERLDAIYHGQGPLARRWSQGGPRRLWMVSMGQGYAAAAVAQGCVYVLDHDVDRSADTLRCLSLDDGREIWRNGYPVVVAEHHGRSRTIPAVVGDYVISFGPKCHVACWDAKTGTCQWLLDLVLDYGATVPPWYAGQCPLIDTVTDRLILAPGGGALLMAVDYRTGQVVWESPNPHAWAMTHVSIVPMELAGRRMYVYCGKGGVAGVAADTGEILWETAEWQIGTATCPSPVVVGPGKVFLCGGYNTGAVMLQVTGQGGRLAVKTLFRLKPRQFSSEQQTPVLLEGHLYGVRQADKQLVCLDLEGRQMWNSGRDKFGAGPYMIADGLLYVLDDVGWLSMIEATPDGYRPLARAEVIEDAYDSWAPMAMVAGRLIVRDMTRMVCLDVAEP